MRQTVAFLFAALSCSTAIHAQKRAVTENGDQVILYDNGTWKFVNDSSGRQGDSAATIQMNPKSFARDPKSSFLVKSSKFDGLGIWIDPTKWSFKKEDNASVPEYMLEMKGESAYAMLITEKVSIPLENLGNIALQNAQQVAPDTRIVHEEYRMVNGLKVLNLGMRGTIQGIKFEYFGYYFSNDKGTVQYVTYFAQSESDVYKPQAEELVNGLVMIQPENKP